MTKNFAIKGQDSRGSDIIDILEMLGGGNVDYISGENESYCYYIDFSNCIRYCSPERLDDNYIIFSIDDFIKKFPYKIGDKVKLYYQDEENDRYCSSIPSTIIGMRWDKSHGVVAYKMEGVDREFYKQEFTYNKDENNAVIAGINLNSTDYADEVEINLGDYEIEVRDGRTFAVLKKPKYPTTYGECCDVIGYDPCEDEINCYKSGDIESFVRLLICRDAYWKIAGEVMGLDGTWEPDWNNHNQPKFGIHNVQNNICPITLHVLKNLILVFPTEEMRDMFLKHFRDLIEKCKELL